MTVANAVKLTDKAELPLAILLKKLEILPPGQAAIIIIPKAKLGWGFMIKIATNVSAGNKKNWEKTPTSRILGFLIRSLKS